MQGGTVTEVPVGHRPRQHGVTKYGMWNRVWRRGGRIRGALDAAPRAGYRVREEV